MIGLPDTLSDQPNVHFRWRIIGNGSGRTGTYRIDDILLTVRRTIDLAIGAVHVPSFPLFVGDQVSVSVTVLNVAARSASNFGVAFFLTTADTDSPRKTDRFDSVAVMNPLAPDDSLLLTAGPIGAVADRRKIVVRVTIVGDEDASNNMRSALMNVGYPPSTVVINEILYAPSSPEPEWIELFNTSTDSIDLKRWSIADNSGRRANLTVENFSIHGLDYLILADDSSLFSVHPAVSSTTLIVNIPSLNNSGDAVVLFDNRNLVMDSLMYSPSWGGSGGRSLERISTSSSSTDPLNWGTSRDPKGSTPGKKNSLTPKDFDLGVAGISFDPDAPFVGEEFTVGVIIENVGVQRAEDFVVELYQDVNRDSVGQLSERLLFVQNPMSIPSGDSATVMAGPLRMEAGGYYLLAVVSFGLDEDLTNNSLFISLRPAYRRGSVLVNEIMYAPGLLEPEWVEFYNTMDLPIDIQGWKISNRNSGSKHSVHGATRRIDPRSYLLITRDSIALAAVHPEVSAPILVASSLPVYFLSNEGDEVVLTDPQNTIIDSVMYQPFWGGGGGLSLERISLLGESNDPDNWGTSKHPTGSTPGFQNTVAPKNFDLTIRRLSIRPNRPTVGEDVFVEAVIANHGLEPTDQYVIEFYEDVNRDSIAQDGELFFLHEGLRVLLSGDSLSLSARLMKISPGYHRIIVQIHLHLDEDTTNNARIEEFKTRFPRGTVVVNEIMYAPELGQPEWVELMNVSEHDVNLAEWTLANHTLTKRYEVAAADYVLRRQSYVVITKDSSVFFTFHPSVTGKVLEADRLPSFFLNNSGDAVVAQDDYGATIDSVAFLANWGGEQGKSLERIDPVGSSTDSSNWGTSVHSLGSTPGRRNSLVPLDTDLAIRRINLDPPFPIVNGIFSVIVTVQNVGFQTIETESLQTYR